MEEPVSCKRAASLSRQYLRKISGPVQSYPPQSRSDGSSSRRHFATLREEVTGIGTWVAPPPEQGLQEDPGILAAVWL